VSPIKPRALRGGDTVAVLSPSWGGPSVFPEIYQLGLENLSQALDVRIKEYPTARKTPQELHENPRARAEDINAAFADPEVSAIVTSIGGDDSVRILPYLDARVLRENPKILLGFSDTTTLLTYVNRLGLVTFHGPSVIAGWAQLASLPPECIAEWRAVLCDPAPPPPFAPFPEYSNGYLDFREPANLGKRKPSLPNPDGWHWLQGSGSVVGELFGGCIEVLEFMKGTAFWPEPEFWRGKTLFLETSEDVPSPQQVAWMLRNYGMQGVFERVTALILGRPRDYTAAMVRELEEHAVSVVSREFGCSELPIVANFDVGHTDPQHLLPLGIRVKVDCNARTIGLVEAAVSTG